MKRILALVLAVTLLLSLFVAPVAAEGGEISFEPAPSVNLTAVSYAVKSHTYISDTGAITSAKPNELLAVKLTLTNNAEKTLNWAGGQFFIKYDETAFEPYSFIYKDEDAGEEITVGPIAKALPKENNGFNYNSKWIGSENVDVPGLIQFTKASAEGQKAINKNESITIAYILFKVKAGAENGVQKFEFDTTRPNAVSAAEEINTASSNIAGIDFSEIHTDNVSVVEGAAPTLAATSVSKNEVVYGSDEVLTLGATSTSNKDITSFVTFKVKDAEGNDAAGFVVNNGNELNVTAADAGTYTVTAEPNGDNCRIDESVTVQNATFTITKQEITAPVVAISNFAKGQLVSGLTVETATSGLSVSATCFDEDGNQLEEERFKAGTTYSISIVLKADKNHVLNAQTLAVTVNGGDEQTVDIVGNVAVVTATTADKDALALLLTPGTTPNAHYGMKLSDLSFTGGTVIAAGDETKKPIDGHFEWVDSTQDVGDPTVYDGTSEPNGRPFAAKFVPTDSENYAELSLNVRVHVHKATISISGINSWNYTEAFKYDGTVHKVELVIPEDLQGKIKVDYENNTATDVNTYKAAATISAVDDAHYAIYESVTTRELDWAIVKGDLAPTDAEKSVLFGTKEVTVTPADFGLTQDGIKIEVTHAGNSLITGYLPSDDMRSVTFMLRDTDKTDAANNASDTATLKFSSANYNEASGTLTIKIIDKNTDADTLKIDVPATVTYGDTVTPSVGESKPAGAGDVTFKFFDEDNHEVLTTAQPFDAGTYKVTASCESESTIYTAEATFTVEPREIEAKDVAFDKELTYTGNELTQTVTVTVNGKTLTVGTDYTVSDLTGTKPGSYPVTVTGTGNYTGTVTKSFEIAKADISSAAITYDAGPYGYTGKEWKPEVTVSFNSATRTAGNDYTVSYENNINAGTAKIIITGIGDHFTGLTEKTFTINSAEISGCTFAPIADVTYNTKAHTPEVTVAISGRTLEADKDYTVSYAPNVNAGTATVTVTGKGNFTGSANTTFTIAKADLNLSVYTISSLCTETEVKTSTLPSNFFLADETETGFSIALTAAGGDAIFTQEPAVVDGENMITYQLNGGTGEATFNVTVTPVSSNYKAGTYDLKIQAYDKTNVSNRIVFESGSAVYTGSGIKYEKATIAGHSSGMRYTYAPDVATGATLDAAGLPLTVGTYTVTATYSDASSYGYKTATFTITKATPAGTPSFTKIETSGKTLADTKLTVGTIRPAGTIAWDLPLTTVLKDGKEYAWTFTPTDTHNYTTLTGKLIPYVDDGTDYIPGVIDGNSGSFNFHDVSRFDYFYDAVKWAAENGIASGTGRYTFSPDAVCTRAQTVTFLWRAAGSPMPRYRTCAFTDVDSRDYYYNAVLWAVEQGITTGLTATTFGPDVTVSRGQVATFLYRAASASKPNTFNPFTDVKTTAYNYDAILWAYDNRITTGTSDTTFSPDASCTRAQIVTFLYRYYQGR